MKRALSVFILVLLLVSMLAMAFRIQPIKAEPRTWTVDDDGPADFSSIQEAINAASNGDAIYVKNGTYYENVEVNKIVMLIGENKENTIVDGGGNAAPIWVHRDNVVVTGFTVRNSNSILPSGFLISSGITTQYASFCTISDNIVTDVVFGISSSGGHNNSISRNTILNARDVGIAFYSNQYSTVIGNSISYTYEGIDLWAGSSHTTIVANTISYCSTGILVETTTFVLVINNIITDNYLGIYLSNSYLNKIYHNSFVDNSQQASLYNSYATWDNGYPSGGNQWSDYTGVDANEDGIGDTLYTVDVINNITDQYPLMESWAEPWDNWNHYHDYTEIARTLIYLNETYPSIVNVFSIGKSWENKDIYCIRLTDESNTHPKPKLLFVGYHHAREPISAELALYFAVDAAISYGTNETITRMLNYSEIYVVPALNVDGFDAVKLNEWQRKNVHPFDEDNDTRLDEDPPEDTNGDGYIAALVRGTPPWEGTIIGWEGIDNDGDGLQGEDWIGGVDINRNYGYQWNATCFSGSPDPSAEDYRGPAPFSEPETQAMRDLALSNDFRYAISFHSGSESIGYPWGYTTDPPADEAIFNEIAANLSALTGAQYGQNSNMYTMSGSWDDWMYGNRSTLAFTCEIYGNNGAWQYEPGPEPDTWWMKGIFQAFNPDTSEIEPVVQRWLPTFTYVTDRAITEAYDIAATNATLLKTVVGQGYPANITVTIKNQGYFTETFNVAAYGNTTIIGSQNVTLTTSNSTTITFTWNTTGFAKGKYGISAYAWPVQGETSTADNNFTGGWVVVSMVGDLTGGTPNVWDFVPDGKVSSADVSVVARCFGSSPQTAPPLRWEPNCDLNNNGKVDGNDVAYVARHFGEADP